MFRRPSFLLLCSLFLTVNAQEHLGLKVGNFSGIHGIQLNPAHNVNIPLNWDLNILSAGIFGSTNYMFLQKGALIKVPFSGGITSDPEIERENSGKDALFYNFSRKYTKFYFHHTGMVMGPSFMFNIPDNSFGIYYGIRTHLSANNISPELGYWYYSDSATETMLVNPFKAGIMAWGELGVNYARALVNDEIRQLSVGITAKYLMGYEGIFWDSRQESRLVKIDDGVQIPNGDLSIDYATNYKYDYENDEPTYQWQRNGNGFAVDIGFEYKDLNVNDPDQPHRFKVALALLDIGKITFNRNASTNVYDKQDTVTYLNSDFEDARDIQQFIKIGSAIAYDGDSNAVNTGNRFSAWMPGAVNAQADFAIGSRYYINGNLTFPVPFKGQGVRRASVIAVTPRIETRRWEVGVPVVLTNFRSFHPGLYARIWYFTIGTDDIASWFIPHKMSGFDFYFALKVQPKDFTERDSKVKWRKLAPCPRF